MSKFKSLLQFSKTKLSIAALSGALVLALGTGATFASQNSSKEAPKKVLEKNVGGVTQTSTDGKKWVKKSQKDTDVKKGKDGKIIVTKGKSPNGKLQPPKSSEYLTKLQDGKWYYSTDGGKTWKITKAEKSEPKKGQIVKHTRGNAPKDDSKARKVKNGEKNKEIEVRFGKN